MVKMVYRFFSLFIIVSLFIFTIPVSLADNTPTGALTGKVIDRNNMPLANATLQLQDSVYNVVGNAISASDGTFTFNNVPITGFDGRDVFRVTATYIVSGKSYSDKTEFFWIYKNQVVTHNVQIYYYPPSNYGWLTGKVVNANNYNQYVSATIYLSNGMYDFVSSEPGDNWQFYLPAGDYQVWAEHNENGKTFSSGKSDVHVNSDDTFTAVLTISLTGNGTTLHTPPSAGVNVVHGNIKQKNDAPLYGATVELCRVNGVNFSPISSTTSDVEGNYRFNGVNTSAPSESYVVRVTYNFMGNDTIKVSDPFTIYYANMLNVSHDYNVPISVDFTDSGSIEAVTDPAGASIWLDGADTGRTTPFNITGVRAGEHTCSLLMDGYLPENLTFNVPSEGTYRVYKVLKPSTGDVNFIIKPSDASIYLNGDLVGTGSTNLTKLQYGQYSYTVGREGYRNVTGTLEVIPGGHLDVPVDLVAVPGLSLTYIGYLINSVFESIGKLFG
ncbi:MAG TPA: carboxypeptidase regulatory-like domain-containing protein [Methanocella sp.]|uniref:carboxypeptidase regulatory-like domain-containing protein n=1 Tax=Methanocella sp. TaxID=2052833 RepID=UPI002BD8AD69|nr:carboxypeptidase regulatory-like domain-containing protein [Methanocella sp.]HTY91249.1 carboxypeptidase regulatory-like domain-containing protein [Methanocella sp.]